MINQRELWLLVIGAGISLVSYLIGFIMQSFYQNTINKQGEIKIYKKLVYSKLDQTTWGFRNENFSVPLWVEFQNTRNQNEVIRNFNLVLYSKNIEVGLMTQITHLKINGNIHQLANNGSYSFILKPNSIERLNLHFTIKKVENNLHFDEVRIRYYDTKDKRKEFQLLKIRDPWTASNNKIDNDWTLLE